MSTNQSSFGSSIPAARSRFTLPAPVAFVGSAIAFTSLYLAAGAPTPLLPLYQEQWNFPAVVLTVAFAAYAGGFLAALLTAGSLSDHIGRRPVLIGALLVQLVSTIMFVLAPDAGWVIAARVVQGIATGAATSAFSASLAELAPVKHKKLGAILGSVGVTGGLALGALLAGFAIEFTSSPNGLIFTVLAVIAVLGIIVVALTPESATRRPGAWRSLIPRVAVPAAARKEFAAAAPVIAATWMLAGLSLGLAPTLVRNVFEIDSALLNGLVGFVAAGASAVSGIVFSRLAPRAGIRLGIYAAAVAAIGNVTSVLTGTLVLMVVSFVIGGIGFGSAFSASLRLIVPLTDPQHRAGTIASVFVVAYIAFGLPVVLVGLLAAPLGLPTTVVGYGAVILLLGLIGLIAQFRVTRAARA
ncbi:MFS transporter [Arthrobacter sp. TMN-37]